MKDLPGNIIKSSTWTYGILSVLGIGICLYAHENLADIFLRQEDESSIWMQVFIGVIAAGILLLLGELFTSWFESFREFKREVESILGNVSIAGGFYLAFVSGIGEELFFRAALQPWLGLTLTSFIFGLLHLGPGMRINSWTIWAIISGFFLGWIFERNGSIIGPTVAHIIVNSVSIQRLRYSYQSKRKPKEEEECN